ncbi:cytochrome P450 72A397-like [Impatiens glandulifera]|uniref:cytochrome P450 72A397-like n=1 Tax=Impatiens glandulifera TaxID=253017 RepID=UPI001FB0873A|nr:cytochrome P450 72A397-like [Impatiens glandulifera]
MENLQFLFPVLITTLLLLLLYIATRVLYSIWWKPRQLQKSIVKQGIKGTPYRLLVGDMKELIRQTKEAWSNPISSLSLPHSIASRVDPFTHHILHNYGKVSFCWMGTSPRLIIKDTELMKEVLSNKEGHFGKPYLNPLILILTKGLTTLEGEEWANHRKIINPAFHLEKLKGMMSVFSTSCGKMIEQWGRQIDLDGGSNCEIDVWSEFQNLTGDIIFTAAFGTSNNSSNHSNEGKKIFKLQKELLGLVMETMVSMYISGFRFIPTKKNRRRKELNRSITSMLRTIVQRKEDEMRNGQSGADNLLGILLQSNQTHKNDNNGMTIDEIIEECKQFYLAGYETTSCLLTWTLIVLAMHQDWQEKARKEILEIYGENLPVAEDIGRLKVTTMILNEVLRLYPPAIAHYLHAYKKTKIGSLSIPAGVDITLPTLILHHDKELWGEDADEFKPERFSEGVMNASKGNQAFFPFGWGPRICIGQNFAMIESKVALAMILQRFSFKLSPSYSHAPYTVMTLQPQHGAQIIFEKLISSKI